VPDELLCDTRGSAHSHSRGDTDVRRLKQALDLVCGVLAVIGAGIIALLMFATVTDVARRALTGNSIEGLVESAPLFLLAAVCLSLGYAESIGAHVRASLVTDRLPRKGRLLLRGSVVLVGALVVFWIGWESINKALEAYEGGETTVGITRVPTWPAKALVPIGFILFALQMLSRSMRDGYQLVTGRDDTLLEEGELS
jgi:TRAP-type mannitol/chloroaromatic compound transport system permease small subunit